MSPVESFLRKLLESRGRKKIQVTVLPLHHRLGHSYLVRTRGIALVGLPTHGDKVPQAHSAHGRLLHR